MFTLIRTIGGGPKNRFKQQGYNLDLTYITPRIIAMSFPSIGLQSVYRNDLQEIVQFLHKKHGQNYMIINVSNRKYQYERFHGQIKDYFWPNHQTPQLKTLFQICSDVTQFLAKNQKNVVAFHCNHGKGRTGTSIISYLLYSGQFPDLKTTIQQYNQKRFSSSSYQIDIPCQVRYLEYFESLLNKEKIDSDIICPLKLTKIQAKGFSKDQNIFVRFSTVKQGEQIGKTIRLNGKNTYVNMKQLFIGDIKVQIYADKVIIGEIKIGYINFNTYFRQHIEQQILRKQLTQKRQYRQHEKITFSPNEIKTKWGYSKLKLTLICNSVKQKQLLNQLQYKESYQAIKDRLRAEKQHFNFINKVIQKRNKYQINQLIQKQNKSYIKKSIKFRQYQ